MQEPVRALFLDIGGIILTNGWDHHSRKRAATRFGYSFANFEERHSMMMELFEEGRISLDEYLSRCLFFQKRSFTRSEFKQFMFLQSQPVPKMLQLMAELRSKYQLKVVVVSNEGRELNDYRIRKFALGKLVDSFISSCFVNVRKPNVEMYRLAMDIAQVRPQEALYIENTVMFVEIAQGLKIRSIWHKDYKTTRAELAKLGLVTGRDQEKMV